MVAALIAGLAMGAWAQENTLAVCSKSGGPIVTIFYSTGPASLSASIVMPKRGGDDIPRRQPVKRFGAGLRGPKPAIVFVSNTLELTVDTSKRAPKFPARLRTLSSFGVGVRTYTLSCLAFEIDADESSCANQNGTWSFQPPACVWPSLDAGKPCTDSAQCESVCVMNDKKKGICYDKTSAD